MKLYTFFKKFSPFLITGVLILTFSGCDNNDSDQDVSLSSDNINLVFVLSSDLAYHTTGDINEDTANLTGQGLHRALLMATYLKEQVLGSKNVDAIYALEPMTHLQTNNNYPDMTAIGSIEQFALLNEHTVTRDGKNYTANSFPINTSYAKESVPTGVLNSVGRYCLDCQGLDFNDMNDSNVKLVKDIIDKNISGYYVFSAPWETTIALLENINQDKEYNLNIPVGYEGSNHVYTISIAPSSKVSFVNYNSNLEPSSEYPELPSPVVSNNQCTYTVEEPLQTITLENGVDGVVVPSGINTNQTAYIVRHAEAHPDEEFKFENGNFVGAGQWRALELHNALRGEIESPDMVYSIDPTQWYPVGDINVSYIRPALTVFPYVVANNLPFYLESTISLFDSNQSELASEFFFKGGKFSGKTMLIAWESGRIKPILNALIESYGGDKNSTLPPKWLSPNYDTIWRVTLDASGNLSVDNDLCEGINSEDLSEEAPVFR